MNNTESYSVLDANPRCPDCHKHSMKNGTSGGRRYFMCRHCDLVFSAANTREGFFRAIAEAYARKKGVECPSWRNMVELIRDVDPPYKIAEGRGLAKLERMLRWVQETSVL